MIYSSIEDNWFRVKIMHDVLSEYYNFTKKSEFRERLTKGGEFFPFDVKKYDAMEKESSLVGMVMAWSVVTIECLVNHVIAESLNDKNIATEAIEYPKKIAEKRKIPKTSKSELSKKISILFYPEDRLNEITKIADELSGYRNLIMHDKPFDYNDFGEGEFDISYFRSRGESLGKTLRFEDIVDFYKKCDVLVSYIFDCSDRKYSNIEEYSFSGLL